MQSELITRFQNPFRCMFIDVECTGCRPWENDMFAAAFVLLECTVPTAESFSADHIHLLEEPHYLAIKVVPPQEDDRGSWDMRTWNEFWNSEQNRHVFDMIQNEASADAVGAARDLRAFWERCLEKHGNFTIASDNPMLDVSMVDKFIATHLDPLHETVCKWYRGAQNSSDPRPNLPLCVTSAVSGMAVLQPAMRRPRDGTGELIPNNPTDMGRWIRKPFVISRIYAPHVCDKVKEILDEKLASYHPHHPVYDALEVGYYFMAALGVHTVREQKRQSNGNARSRGRRAQTRR